MIHLTPPHLPAKAVGQGIVRFSAFSLYSYTTFSRNSLGKFLLIDVGNPGEDKATPSPRVLAKCVCSGTPRQVTSRFAHPW